jgi:hypothetical protein
MFSNYSKTVGYAYAVFCLFVLHGSNDDYIVHAKDNKADSGLLLRGRGLQTNSILNLIKRDILDLIRPGPNNNNNIDLRPKFLRLGFHDSVGGVDGCVDLENADNNGLEIPISALEPIVAKYVDVASISRADIWAMATLIAADDAERGNNIGEFSMTHIGRVDCEKKGTPCLNKDGDVTTCGATSGPHRDLPGPDMDTHQLLQFFSEGFGFNPRETVAIMGAHTIGTLSRAHSGFDGPRGWLNNNRALTNGYYAQLVGGTSIDATEDELRNAPDWTVEFIDNSNLEDINNNDIPSRFQWFHQNNNGKTIMLNSDIALVRDLSSDNEDTNDQYLNGETGEVTGCQFKCRGPGCNNPNNRTPPVCPLARITLDIAAEYKFDNELWVNDFEAVLIKMLKNGYEYDDDDDEDCNEDEPCILIPTETEDDGEADSPSDSPTKADPNSESCDEDSTNLEYKNNSKKHCGWVGKKKKKTKKRCKKKENGTRIWDWCPKTCAEKWPGKCE